MKNLKAILVIALVTSTFIMAQNYSSKSSNNITDLKQKYFNDSDSNITMFVSVWGHVGRPGLTQVHDGIDMGMLLSYVGGPLPGANLKSIKLYREQPDIDGNLVYDINFVDFLNTGDRSSLKIIKPNDTIIVKETFASYLISKANIFSLIITALNFLQITNN